MMIFKLIC